MKEFVVLLSAALAVLAPCGAAPALEPVTCADDLGVTAARFAVHHINDNQHHGYKFKLNEIQSSKVEQVEDGCNIVLQFTLRETKCHVVNPKHFEQCDVREVHERAVIADCQVVLVIKDGVTNLTKYECETKKEMSNMDFAAMCPDCPMLLPLNTPEGLKAAHETVRIINKNETLPRYYVLLDLGRIRLGEVVGVTNYYAEVAIVESHCKMGTRILPEACKPLCPDRANHGFCHSTYSSKGISIQCEIYLAVNTTILEKEPKCPPSHHTHPHPPHIGPPMHVDNQGPPPHAGGNRDLPPKVGVQRPIPPHVLQIPIPPHTHPFHLCSRSRTADAALHTICDWPRQTNPEPSL